jgi:hypothetical protein
MELCAYSILVPHLATRGHAKQGDSPITYRDVYIGELSSASDPLDWGGGWNGNVPNATSPMFPPHGIGSLPEYPFSQLIDRISSGKFQGKQVDWGGWAAKVTRREILDFIADVYGGDEWYTDPTVMPHLYERMQTLMEYVGSLPEDGTFALVATEL